jgi:hypothetical protein
MRLARAQGRSQAAIASGSASGGRHGTYQVVFQYLSKKVKIFAHCGDRVATRCTIALAALVFYEPAHSEWMYLLDIPSSYGEKVYFETIESHRDGKYSTIVLMENFDKPIDVWFGLGTSYRSERVVYEFDCSTDQMRQLALIEYSGPMGSGRAVYEDGTPGGWRVVSKGSFLGMSFVERTYWMGACGKQ